MKTAIICFIVLIFLSNGVFAFQMSLKPAHIKFMGISGEEICEDMELYSDKETVFIVDDKWSRNNEGSDFTKYNLNSDEIGMHVNYPKEINSVKGIFKFCVSTEEEGNYFGIIYFRDINGPGAIGSLVEAEISKGIEGMLIGLSSFNLLLYSVLLILLIVGNSKQKRDI